MIKVLFFAQIREMVGQNELNLDKHDLTVAQMIALLASQGDKWSLALTEKTVLCAVNKTLVAHDWIIKAGDEVAFFPPVTGG
ncbi:molybdopterin synthase sulfur carrier subunit [Utexia brackfieldae]|uniref:molybdopterin synthase sulfur carrier subunit n=1 Tax=Utexia brackfieldae TaxID=3074108 RepID=UPI00370D92CE